METPEKDYVESAQVTNDASSNESEQKTDEDKVELQELDDPFELDDVDSGVSETNSAISWSGDVLPFLFFIIIIGGIIAFVVWLLITYWKIFDGIFFIVGIFLLIRLVASIIL